jgi:hypothetical protein
MSYYQQWRILSARIHSLTKAGELYGLLNSSSDSYSVYKLLAQQCRSVLDAIDQYRLDFQNALPEDVSHCFEVFFSGNDGRNVAVIREKPSESSALFGLVALSALESEISFLLSDKQEQIFARSERAFLHLQRLLVVDDAEREKWRSAFEESGETKCEKLGAVHLLWHGIFAFKAISAASATDLVFNEPIEDTVDRKGIEGLVLTEWKVGDPGSAERRFGEARRQAQLYETSTLAGVELRRYRYAIVVSLDELPQDAVPADAEISGVIYRHINIFLDRRTISERARS